MSKEREELITILNDAWSLPSIPKTRPLKDGTVIDEDKSVKWNREKVEASKLAYNEELMKLRRAKHKAIRAAEAEIMEYIKDSLDKDYPEEKLRIIYNRAYDTGHSSGAYSIMDEIDDLTDFINEMNE